MADGFQVLGNTAHAQRGGAHVDPAAARAEIHGHADHPDFLRHGVPSGFKTLWECPRGTSRIYALEHAREWNHLADVRGSANPGHRAFEAQPETGMRHRAVAPQVQVPLE